MGSQKTLAVWNPTCGIGISIIEAIGIKDGKSAHFLIEGRKVEGEKCAYMDAWMGENRVRGLDRAVVRRQMMEKLAKKHNDPEGVGSRLPGGERRFPGC